MSYAVVRKSRMVPAAAQPATTGVGNHDGSGAMGLGAGRGPSTGVGKSTGTVLGKGTGVGKSTGTVLGKGTGVGKSTGTDVGKSTVTCKYTAKSAGMDTSTGKGTGAGKGSSPVLRRYAATHQKATPQKSAQKTTHNYGAYSVTVPDQKKWSDLQKKAAAELAALEKLKRRNIGHISITPSAVGGTLTQEEVRRRQQQDFSKAEMAQPELSGQQSPKNET